MRESMLPVQREMVERDLGSTFDLAETCALLGKKEEALRYLQLAYERREIGFLSLSHKDNFDILRGNPTYIEITARRGTIIGEVLALAVAAGPHCRPRETGSLPLPLSTRNPLCLAEIHLEIYDPAGCPDLRLRQSTATKNPDRSHGSRRDRPGRSGLTS